MRERQILLYMDNVSSHVASDVSLSNVTIKFLPANTTSCLQPLDAGIIKTFKLHFRKLLLNHVVARMDDSSSATELARKLNVLYAVNWIVTSWKAVSEETIVKCFRRCGFIWSDQEEDV